MANYRVTQNTCACAPEFTISAEPWPCHSYRSIRTPHSLRDHYFDPSARFIGNLPKQIQRSLLDLLLRKLVLSRQISEVHFVNVPHRGHLIVSFFIGVITFSVSVEHAVGSTSSMASSPSVRWTFTLAPVFSRLFSFSSASFTGMSCRF